jgi:cytochrome c peroxidase
MHGRYAFGMIGFASPRIAAAAVAVAAACTSGTSAAQRSESPSFYAPSFSRTPTVAEKAALGRALFFDPSLSASGRMACSSCHDPGFAYGPPNDRAVQRGGPAMNLSGFRAVPSLRYLQTVPPFAEHRFDEAIDESIDQGVSGGHTWDGRADSLHDQARLPLLSRFEMANRSPEEVVARARRGSSAAGLRNAFGDDVFDSDERAFMAILAALEVFQQSPADFYPYSSRYDAWLRGRGELSDQELRGLRLFDDPKKGNCASCHPSRVRHGAFPQFTDFGYAALGVARNARIPANADPRFRDLGLCGPERKDLAGRSEYCGMFRVPTLRNVAVRRTFFHNGKLHGLTEVVEFYAQRETKPQRWYPVSGGAVTRFDDLPIRYRGNINREPPFDRKPGDAPALDDAEIADIVAFLGTLTDADVAAAAASLSAPRPAPMQPPGASRSPRSPAAPAAAQ